MKQPHCEQGCTTLVTSEKSLSQAPEAAPAAASLFELTKRLCSQLDDVDGAASQTAEELQTALESTKHAALLVTLQEAFECVRRFECEIARKMLAPVLADLRETHA